MPVHKEADVYLLDLWLLGKRDSGQRVGLQVQLLPSQLPLLNLHQTFTTQYSIQESVCVCVETTK